MTPTLTRQELEMLAGLPLSELTTLARELERPVPSDLPLGALAPEIVLGYAALAAREGLPLSRYDADELAALPSDELSGLARLCGVAASVSALTASGRRAWKLREKRHASPLVALHLPLFLAPLARYGAAGAADPDAARP